MPDNAARGPAGTPTVPPFKTDEPEKYQTFIVQSTPTETTRFLVARDGDKWRIDSAHGTSVHTASIHTDRDYVVAFGPKAYSEYQTVHGYDERPNMVNEITLGLLNGQYEAVYEKLDGTDGITKYRYMDAKGKESIVTYDVEQEIPIKKEVFVVKDGVRSVETTVSLEGFTSTVDTSLFEIPSGFKLVSPQDMRNILVGK